MIHFLFFFMKHSVESHDTDRVVVVGAGPVGLATALELARQGVNTTILERNHGPICNGSRAIVVDNCSLDMFQRLGAAEIFDRGLKPKGRETYLASDKLFEANFPQCEKDRLPLFVNLQQYETERILREVAQKTLGAVNILWGHEVDAVDQCVNSVTLSVKSVDGPKTLKSPYVVACDGASSSMRKLLNLSFPGFTDDSSFAIVDVKAPLDSDPIHRFTFNPVSGQGQTQLIVPQPDGVWRLDWQLFRGEDPKRKMLPDSVASMVKSTIGESVPFEVVWSSCYRFHQRALERFKHDRVFFAGDAAHLVAPFGARGMNSGLRDGRNLAWKIARVVKGESSSALLETYNTERVSSSRQNQDVTTETMRFISPENVERQRIRDEILRRSNSCLESRGKVNSGKMSVPESYKGSPLNFGTHRLVGEKAPDIDVDGNGGMLRRFVGDGFTIMHFDSSGDVMTSHEGEIALSSGVRMALDVKDGDRVIIRPDGYIGAVCADRELACALGTVNGDTLAN